MSSLHSDLIGITGRRLTQLLDHWADRNRLDARRAAAIRREIVTRPAATDFDRWWQLLDPVNGTAFRARRGRRSVEIVQEAPPAIKVTQRHWHHLEPDFQPYLRL